MSVQVFSKNKADLLKFHGKTQADLDRDVLILKNWIKQEPHLPSIILNKDDNFLEVSLIRNKYSIEKTKSKIENYCTLKGQYRYLFENIIGTIKPAKEAVFYHYMEQLIEDKLQRILLFKVFDEENYDLTRELGVALTQREITSRYDYNDGEILIADYTECSAQFVTKLKLNALVHAMSLVLNGHSARIKEVHVINRWANVIITFGKNLFPEKLRSRIYGYDSVERLKDVISVKYLPKDYGGEQKSLREMQDDWVKIFDENRQLMETAYNTVSREDLRIEPTTIGLQGTFKQLSID